MKRLGFLIIFMSISGFLSGQESRKRPGQPLISMPEEAIQEIAKKPHIETEMVKLQSLDGEEFAVTKGEAEESETIHQMISDIGTDQPIPLATIESEYLAVIVQLLKLLNKDQIAQAQEIIRQYSLSHEFSKTLELTKRINYLDIKKIFDFTLTILKEAILNDPFLLKIASQQLSPDLKKEIQEKIIDEFLLLFLHYKTPELQLLLTTEPDFFIATSKNNKYLMNINEKNEIILLDLITYEPKIIGNAEDDIDISFSDDPRSALLFRPGHYLKVFDLNAKKLRAELRNLPNDRTIESFSHYFIYKNIIVQDNQDNWYVWNTENNKVTNITDNIRDAVAFELIEENYILKITNNFSIERINIELNQSIPFKKADEKLEVNSVIFPTSQANFILVITQPTTLSPAFSFHLLDKKTLQDNIFLYDQPLEHTRIMNKPGNNLAFIGQINLPASYITAVSLETGIHRGIFGNLKLALPLSNTKAVTQTDKRDVVYLWDLPNKKNDTYYDEFNGYTIINSKKSITNTQDQRFIGIYKTLANGSLSLVYFDLHNGTLYEFPDSAEYEHITFTPDNKSEIIKKGNELYLLEILNAEKDLVNRLSLDQTVLLLKTLGGQNQKLFQDDYFKTVFQNLPADIKQRAQQIKQYREIYGQERVQLPVGK